MMMMIRVKNCIQQIELEKGLQQASEKESGRKAFTILFHFKAMIPENNITFIQDPSRLLCRHPHFHMILSLTQVSCKISTLANIVLDMIY